MVLKLFRDLQKITFITFIKKALHDRETCHLLAASLIFSKEDGHRRASTEAVTSRKAGHRPFTLTADSTLSRLDKQDTGKSIGRDKIGQSFHISASQLSLSDILGL